MLLRYCCDECVCCVFFCFKQKTAYEMRISDWSSDVCSSDLDETIVRSPMFETLAVMAEGLADAEQPSIAVIPAVPFAIAHGRLLDHRDPVPREAEGIFGDGDRLRPGQRVR